MRPLRSIRRKPALHSFLVAQSSWREVPGPGPAKRRAADESQAQGRPEQGPTPKGAPEWRAGGRQRPPKRARMAKADSIAPLWRRSSRLFNRLALCMALSHDRIQRHSASHGWTSTPQAGRSRIGAAAFRLQYSFKDRTHPQAMSRVAHEIWVWMTIRTAASCWAPTSPTRAMTCAAEPMARQLMARLEIPAGPTCSSIDLECLPGDDGLHPAAAPAYAMAVTICPW